MKLKKMRPQDRKHTLKKNEPFSSYGPNKGNEKGFWGAGNGANRSA